MTSFRLDDLSQYSDVLRSRSGTAVTVRFVEPRDAEALQNYFRSLTTGSRYNRFLGAASELPPSLLNDFIHVGEADRFSVIATMLVDGYEIIVGEARYAFNAGTASIEFGLSIDDRWQGQGIGKALLKNLECRAAVRRHAALQRSHDRPRPQIRLRLYRQPRRLEAGALRKTHRCRAPRHPLRELEARRCLPPSRDPSSRELTN